MFGWGGTKMRSPIIGLVLHWRPPHVHIFHTDPSLINTDERHMVNFQQANQSKILQPMHFS